MNEQLLQDQIDAINQKLDIILEEISLQRRHRQEMDDLKDDLMRVGKDIYQTALVELEDVHDNLSTGDIMHLGKTGVYRLEIPSWHSFFRNSSLGDPSGGVNTG